MNSVEMLDAYFAAISENERQLAEEILSRLPEKSFSWDDFRAEQIPTGILSVDQIDAVISKMREIYQVHLLEEAQTK